MATLTTAATNFGTVVQDLVSKSAEEELRSSLPHLAPGQYVPGTIIKGTDLIRYVRIPDAAAQTTPLTEGSPPTAQALTIQTETLTVAQYGGVFEITDLAEAEFPLDLIAVNAERAGRQAAVTMDTIVRDILAAGTNVKYAGTATSRATVASTMTLTGALVKRMFWFLKNANVPTFGDGTYHCVCTPQQAYDLEADTATGGWMDIKKYTNVAINDLLSGEVGMYAGVRFMVSSQAKVFVTAGSGSADVHSAIFLGSDAYAVGDLQALRSYFIAPGGDHNDPIAQKAIIGWKVAFGAELIDQAGARYVRLESGATTL